MKIAVAKTIDTNEFDKARAEIERSKEIVSSTRKSMAEWHRLDRAQQVLRYHAIGYDRSAMERAMNDIEHEVVRSIQM